MTPSSAKSEEMFKYIHDTGDNEFSIILRNYRLAKKYAKRPPSASVTGTEQTGHTTSVANNALHNDELLEQPLTNEEEKAAASVSAKKARPYKGLASPEKK